LPWKCHNQQQIVTVSKIVPLTHREQLKSLLAILDNGGTWKQILASSGSQNKGMDEGG